MKEKDIKMVVSCAESSIREIKKHIALIEGNLESLKVIEK